MWKVAWAGGLRWEGPTCNNGRAKSWHSWFGIKTRLSILIPTLSLLSVSHTYTLFCLIYTHSLSPFCLHIHSLLWLIYAHTLFHTHTLSHTFSQYIYAVSCTHTQTHTHTNTHITFSLLLLFYTQSLPPRHGRVCHTPV